MDFQDIYKSYLYRKYWFQGLLHSKGGQTPNSNFSHHYFFIHLPKTCGTSFRFMLYRQFGQKNSYPSYYQMQHNGGRYLDFINVSPSELELMQNSELIMGHYPFIMAEKKLIKPIRYLVFLRDPVKRTISYLSQLKRSEPKYHQASLDEIFDKEKVKLLNFQTRWLSQNPWKKVVPFPKGSLAQAKTNLDSIEFIGIAESFDSSVELVEKMFGWDLGRTLNMNVQKPQKKEAISEALLQKIETHTRIDQKLYEYGVSLFEAKLKEFGIQ